MSTFELGLRENRSVHRAVFSCFCAAHGLITLSIPNRFYLDG
jgi:hypothetical protein